MDFEKNIEFEPSFISSDGYENILNNAQIEAHDMFIGHAPSFTIAEVNTDYDNDLEVNLVKESMNIERQHAKQNGRRLYRCNLCSETFRRRIRLSDHVKTVHNGKRHPCIKCGKTFQTSDHLKRHSAAHSDRKDFICKICNRELKLRGYLNRHMKRHKSNGRFSPTYDCGIKASLAQTSFEDHINNSHDDNSERVNEVSIEMVILENIKSEPYEVAVK